MNSFGIAGCLAGASSTIFGLLVFFKCPNRRLARIWMIFSLSVALWGLGNVAVSFSRTPESSLLFWRLTYAFSVPWIASTFLHFVVVFLDLNHRKVLLLNYVLAAFFASAISLNRNLVGVKWMFGSVYYVYGWYVYNFQLLWWSMLILFSHYLLISNYLKADVYKRNQIRLFFIATAFGFGGGAIDYLPSIGVNVYPYGNYAVCLYPFLMFYAIIKHKLLDIKIIVRKTLIYSLATGVLAALMAVIAIASSHIAEGVLGRQTFSLLITACVVAALFHPIQLKIQDIVDRYIFHDWADRAVAREIAAGFSHELKYPLAGLSLRAEMTLAELDEVEKGGKSLQEVLPKIKQELGYILSQALDAARRIEAVRGVAEPEGGQLEAVDVAPVLEEALAVLKSRIAESSVDIKRELRERLPAVSSNAKQLEIVFINLIKNALDSMENSSRQPQLMFCATVSQGIVEISVKDTGPGIPAKDIPRIFEPHFTTKGSKGTGMGLYLTHQIIEAHGGSLELKSEEGKGCEFIVKLVPCSRRLVP